MNRVPRTAAVASIALLAALWSCSADGPAVPRPPAGPAPTAEQAHPAGPAAAQLPATPPGQSAPLDDPTLIAFWDNAIEEVTVKQQAHVQRIDLLLRFHGMPEPDRRAYLQRMRFDNASRLSRIRALAQKLSGH